MTSSDVSDPPNSLVAMHVYSPTSEKLTEIIFRVPFSKIIMRLFTARTSLSLVQEMVGGGNPLALQFNMAGSPVVKFSSSLSGWLSSTGPSGGRRGGRERGEGGGRRGERGGEGERGREREQYDQ